MLLGAATGFVLAAQTAAQEGRAAGKELTSAGAVHALSQEQAGKGLPVHLRGVVTFYDVPTNSLFVSDATGGVYVWVPPKPVLPLKRGTLVDITGVSQPGDFAAIVSNRRLSVLGQSRQPTRAPRVSVEGLATGMYDCQWVEIEGVIRSVSRAGHMVTLKIATSDGSMLALMPARPQEDYERLTDARVRVRGVAGIEYNRHKQMTGSHLMVPSLDEVRVLGHLNGDAFSLPVRNISQLAQFDLHLKPSDRIHLRGRVSLQWPGRLLCIQDATGGVCVDTPITEPYQLGSVVDLGGYPVFASQIPAVADVVVRPGSAESLPGLASQRVSVQEVMKGDESGRLLSLEGELVGLSSDARVWQLTIRSQEMTFSAQLPKGPNSAELGDWRAGSYVRVLGVCVNEVDPRVGQDWKSAQQIASFHLLLRQPADVVVLRKPSWWTPAHTSVTLSAVVLAMLAVAGWVVLLRRQVDQKTQELRESERRFRHLAHHDPLTGLPNRAWFHERAQMALGMSRRNGNRVGLLLLDLDHFKPINDTLGHDAGDALLCALAERASAAVRKVDTVARLGGDEFAVVLPDVSTGEDAEAVARKILAAVCQPVTIKGRQVAMSVSIGVAVFPEDGDSETELLRSADLAMYESKKLARGGVRRYQREAAVKEVATMSQLVGLG
jgi:diguanylate cyclase (GGDEF)-like protein